MEEEWIHTDALRSLESLDVLFTFLSGHWARLEPIMPPESALYSNKKLFNLYCLSSSYASPLLLSAHPVSFFFFALKMSCVCHVFYK